MHISQFAMSSTNSRIPRYLSLFLGLVLALAWVPTSHAAEIDLTAEERAWLDSSPPIRVGPAPNFPPMEFFDEEGIYRGIAADYLALMAQRLGAEFEIVQFDSWADNVAAMQQGQVDVWMEAGITDERRAYLNFTEPYLFLPTVVIVRSDETEIAGWEDLAGKVVAVGSGFATEGYLRENMPTAEVIPVPDIPTGLRMVSFGNADALLVSDAPASYYIEQLGLNNLMIVGESGFRWELALATRNEIPHLHAIMSKALESITPEERQEIRRRWVSVQSTDDNEITTMVLSAVTFAMVLLIILLVGMRLRAGVSVRAIGHGAVREWPIVSGAVLAMILVVGITWLIQRDVVRESQVDIRSALRTVLSTTGEALHQWIIDRQTETLRIANAPPTSGLTEDVLAAAAANDLQLVSVASVSITQVMAGRLDGRRFSAFELVGSDGRLIAASNPQDQGGVADPRLIALLSDPDAGAGDVRVLMPDAHPDSTDAELAGIRDILFAKPYRDDEGAVLGLFVLRIPATEEFTKILQRGRMGESGESYAFNTHGQLLSSSRFEDQLAVIGLLAHGESTILNLELRDPGGNMTTGFRPQGEPEALPLTRMAESAISGRSGSDVIGYNDYRGVPVLGAWIWNSDYSYGITTEIDVEEAYASIRRTQQLAVFTSMTTVTLIFLLTGYSIRMRRLTAREGDRRTTEILQNALDAVVMADADQRIILWNEQAEVIFGVDAATAIGQKVGELIVPPETRDVHNSGYSTRVHHGLGSASRQRLETVAQRADGSTFPVELTVLPLVHQNSMIYCAFIRDISALKEAQDNLEQLNANLQQRVDERTQELAAQSYEFEKLSIYQGVLLDSIPNPIFVKDASGVYTSCNRAFEDAFGHRREDIVGKTILEMEGLPEDKRAAFHRKDLENIRSGEDTFEEVVTHFSDGEPRHMVAQRRPFKMPDGSTGGLLVVLVDITERKRMEQEILESREAAEAANEAKSAFLANMSHELRTPMNAIIGYSEMLAEDAEDDGNDSALADLNKISAAGKHLLSLINAVLDLSKIEAGRMDVFVETFDLQEMLEDSISTTKTLVDKNSNQMVTDFGPELGNMSADVTKTRQIIFNMISNAAKFTDQGTITLAAHRFEREGSDWVRISVQDSGVGIPEDKQAYVFEEFTQADESTTRDFGGTGLGLSLSRHLCQLMGGDMTLESEVGVGSTFIVEMPADVVVVEAEDVSDVSAANAGGSILVVDDDPSAREIARRTLEAAGYTVVVAAHGAQALEVARKQKPRLIVLDMIMPGKDGWAVMGELSRSEDLRDVPVVVLSIIADRQLAEKVGAVGHLSKPVDREALVKITQKFVGTASEDGALVLIIDDDAMTRQVIRKSLEPQGFRVQEAADGLDGLARVRQERPALVLLDLMMPNLDGFGFLDRAREEGLADGLQIIVITAKDLDETDRARLAGRVERLHLKQGDDHAELLAQLGETVSSILTPCEAD